MCCAQAQNRPKPPLSDRQQPQRPSSLDTPSKSQSVDGLFTNTHANHPVLIHHTYFNITCILLLISSLPIILLSVFLCSSHITMSIKCPTDSLPQGRHSINAGDQSLQAVGHSFTWHFPQPLHLFMIRLIHIDTAHLCGQHTHRSQLVTFYWRLSMDENLSFRFCMCYSLGLSMPK